MNLIPYPSGTVREYGERIVVPAAITADLGDFARWSVIAFENRMGTALTPGDWLRLCRAPELPPEGYRLEITPQGVLVSAASEQGVIWALTTFNCLQEDGGLPCCTIEDAPRCAHRGLNLDCARHFFPVREVKKVIETLALAKMNVLHWHLSDDQGWRIESRRFPRLNRISKEFYTQSQIRDIVEFARLRGVEIIPEIDLPGHTTAILSAYPDYSCFGQPRKPAEEGGIYSVILCPGKDEVLEFTKELLEEVASLFPGPRFHIGGDEAPKSEWKKCPDCAERMKELGLSDYEELQGWFLQSVSDVLRSMGKTPILWDDALLSHRLPEGAQVQYWMQTRRQELQTFAEQGGRWIDSDMLTFYFDYPYSMTSLKKVYSMGVRPGKRNLSGISGSLGLECCLWTEQVITGEQLERRLFPRAYAVAELSWSGPREYGDFLRRTEAELAKPIHRGLSAMDRNWWDPSGRGRRKEALRFLEVLNSGEEPEPEENHRDTPAEKKYRRAYYRSFFRIWDYPALYWANRKK